jgi:hypothetical protein
MSARNPASVPYPKRRLRGSEGKGMNLSHNPKPNPAPLTALPTCSARLVGSLSSARSPDVGADGPALPSLPADECGGAGADGSGRGGDAVNCASTTPGTQ